MFSMIKLFDLFSHSDSKPVAKAYVEPAGAVRNHNDRAVNPLLIKGLYGS